MSERTYTRQDVDDIVAPWLKLCKEQSDELAELREALAARKSVNSMGAKLARLCLSLSEYMPDDEAQQMKSAAHTYLKAFKSALQERGE